MKIFKNKQKRSQKYNKKKKKLISKVQLRFCCYLFCFKNFVNKRLKTHTRKRTKTKTTTATATVKMTVELLLVG